MFQGNCCHPISPSKDINKNKEDGEELQLSIDEND